MNEAFDRIYQSTTTRTQTELAAILGIRQSSISDARRRAKVPADWLLKLLTLYRLNPSWILTGQSPRDLPIAPSLVESPPPAGAMQVLFQELAREVAAARQAHSCLGRDFEQARRAVKSEFLEWESQSLLVQNPDGSLNQKRLEKSRTESRHCIAVHIRYLLGDYPAA